MWWVHVTEHYAAFRNKELEGHIVIEINLIKPSCDWKSQKEIQNTISLCKLKILTKDKTFART